LNDCMLAMYQAVRDSSWRHQLRTSKPKGRLECWHWINQALTV
jgi:hypothetical protein